MNTARPRALSLSSLSGPWSPLAAALALAALSACDDSGISTGRVRVQLSDAPFPFELIDSTAVTVDTIDIHIAANNSSASGFHVLNQSPQVFDLLALQNGVTASLADAEVPTGKITEIRLQVSQASVTLTDGRTFDLTIPSGDESGLKIFPSPHITIETDLTTDLLLDFDVSRSFHPIPSGATQAAEIEGFTFTPSLRATNLSAAGALAGRVWSTSGTLGDIADDVPIAGAAVTAYQSGEELHATSTDSEGRYVLLGLPPGSVSLVATATGFAADSLTASVVVANEIGGNDFRLTPSGF